MSSKLAVQNNHQDALKKASTKVAIKTARPLFTSFCIGIASSLLSASLLAAPCGVADAMAAVPANLTLEGDVYINKGNITASSLIDGQNVGMGTTELGKDLRNEGSIRLKGQTVPTYGMYDSQNSTDSIEEYISNEGDIVVEATNLSYGIYGNTQAQFSDKLTINNSGTITVASTGPNKQAYGIYATVNTQNSDNLTVNNSGNIIVTASGTTTSNAYGISAGTSAYTGDIVTVNNSGNITVTSATGTATGITAIEGSHYGTTGTAKVVNDGVITVSGALTSYGVQVRASTGQEAGEEDEGQKDANGNYIDPTYSGYSKEEVISVTNNKLIKVSSIIDDPNNVDTSWAYGYAYGIEAVGSGQNAHVLVTNAGTIDIEATKSSYGINAMAHSSYSGTVTVKNSGNILVKSDGLGMGVFFGSNVNNRGYGINTGSIKVTGGSTANGIATMLPSEIINDGTIQATATTADGSQGTRATNDDPMKAQGRQYGGARGITAASHSSQRITNNGIITATGPDDAYGVSAYVGYKEMTNTNTINVTSQNEAYGVTLYGHENIVRNSGNITIDTVNSGAGVYIYGSSNVDTINDGTISVTSSATGNTGQCFYGIYANSTSMSTQTTEEEDAQNIFFNAKSDIVNNGTINLSANGIEAYGVFAQTNSHSPIATRNNMSNSGDINVVNAGDNAVGILHRSLMTQDSNHHYGSFIVPLDMAMENTGNIDVTSANGEAYGIQHTIEYVADLSNSPSMHFTDLLYAERITNTISNSKNIEANGVKDTYGIYSSISSGSHIDSYFRRNAGTKNVTQYTQEFNNTITNESGSSILATSKNGKAYGIFAALNSYADTKATGIRKDVYGSGSTDIDYTIDYHYTDTINHTVTNAGTITASSEGTDRSSVDAGGHYHPASDNVCGIHSEVTSIFAHKKVEDFTDKEKDAFIDTHGKLPGSSTNEDLFSTGSENDYIPDIYSTVRNMGTLNLISNAGDICGMYSSVTTSSDSGGIHQHISHIVTNDGVINAKTVDGNACGMYSALTTTDGAAPHTTSPGVEHAGFADGIYASEITNNGILNVRSENGEAYGIYVELSNANIKINNYGDMYVHGGKATHDVFVHGRGDKLATAYIGTWHITLRDYDDNHSDDVFACSGTGTIDFSHADFIVTPGTAAQGFAFNTEYAVQDMVNMTATTNANGNPHVAGPDQTAAIGLVKSASTSMPFLIAEVLHGDVNGIPFDCEQANTAKDKDIEQTIILRTNVTPETSPGHEVESQVTTAAAQTMNMLSSVLTTQLDYDELPESWRAFAVPYYTHSVNYDYGYDTDIMGIALGATHRLSDSFSAGAHINLATIDTESSVAENDALMAGLGVHAKYHFTDDFHIRGQVTGFVMENNLNLTMNTKPSKSSSEADTTSLGVYAAMFAAYDYQANEQHTFTPELALKYIFTKTDGYDTNWYHANGLPANHDISYGDASLDELYAEASLRWKGNYDLGIMENDKARGSLHPTMRVGVRQALTGAEVESKLHYKDFDLGTTTSDINQTSVLLEGGLEWVKGDTTTSLSYIGEFGEQEESHMGLLKIEFEF